MYKRQKELLLAVLRGPYEMMGIEPGSAACKVIALPAYHSSPYNLILIKNSYINMAFSLTSL